MKAEPLKDKEIVGNDGHIGLFDKDDVASAVAWLKKEIMNVRNEYNRLYEETESEESASCILAYNHCLIKIDEAFEDAVKDEGVEVR